MFLEKEMDIEYKREYSRCLKRDMEYKVYGKEGLPCIFFPCQNGRFYDFENFGILDILWNYIMDGKIQVFTPDCIDIESWSNDQALPRQRMEQQERWYHYITEEFVPRVKQINRMGRTLQIRGILSFGCSLGGFHSANFFFRRPDLFDRNLSLSGIYRARYFFGDYMDPLVYDNSPCDYLANMAKDHPYVKLYNERKNIICTGQGDWEEESVKSTKELEHILKKKGIHTRFECWGSDANHDWYWWKKQIAYYIPFLINE